jgi:peptide/nickel transport system substrate-binding protein
MPNTARRRSRPLLTALVALASLTALALAACTAPTPDMSQGSVAEGEISIATTSTPNSLDPAQLVDGQQSFVWGSVLDTLLARNLVTGELEPNAAESWEYNEDGTELTLKIREGMTFSDGDPVDANAVAATMTRTKDTAGLVQPKFTNVTEIEAVDDYTVVVHFSAFDPQFLHNLPLGAGAIGDPDTLDDSRTATDPVGSGPYTLDTASTVPGSSYVLTKRDDYWNADAFPFSKVTVKILSDPTATFNALQSGEVDASTVRTELVNQLDTDTFTINEITAASLVYLDILDRGGEKWPALGDQRVRQAINYAIDREGIRDGLLGSNAVLTEQIFNPSGDVFDEALNETYPYDPAKGRELVEDAGFAGETFQIPSTFLSTHFETTLSQAFTDIGLNIEWVAVPPQQAQSAHFSGDYGMTFQITAYTADPADAFFYYGLGGFANPRNFTDPTIERMFGTINTTVDFDQALPAYQELNEYGVDQAFVAPIALISPQWATRDGITFEGKVAGLPYTFRLFGVEA